MADIPQIVFESLRHIPPSDGIMVALSGGADSVALATAVSEAVKTEGGNRPITLLHCNFHLRGEESDRDEALAQKVAGMLGIIIETVDFHDVKGFAAKTGQSIEMACRHLRYDWFEEIRSKAPYTSWLALGHHLEDNRETLMLNLFRGTGAKGLCGMEEIDCQRRFIRPLLRVTRAEIEQYLNSCGMPWIVDSSNLVDDVMRNKLRLNILPAISRDFPDAMKGLDSTAANLADDYLILHQALIGTIDRIRIDDTGTRFDLHKLSGISASPRRVIFEIIRPRGFNSAQARQINNAINSSEAKIFLSNSTRAVLHRGILSFDDTPSSSSSLRFTADSPETLAAISGEFSCQRYYGDKIPDVLNGLIESHTPFFAMDAAQPIPTEWIWRQVETGDRIAPYGMKGRTRLVSDILSDAHASPIQKNQARLLLIDGTPVWLAPFRASGFRPVTTSTREMIVFTLK